MSIVNKLKMLKPYGSIEGTKRQLGDIVEVIGTKRSDEDALVSAIKDVDILMADVDIKVTRRVINAAERLRAIICCSMGVDYVDLDAATKRGVLVCNIPDYAVMAVAEHTMALIFAIARKIVEAHNAAVSGKWDKGRKIRGVELEGKTLAIVGAGKIGYALAKIAAGLGMKILFNAVSPKPEMERDFGAKRCDLDMLLKEADFISLHVPLTEETHHLINEQKLKLMKRTAYLINTSRGPVIEEKALIKTLKEGWIAGAALDVMEKEPPNIDNPLFSLENIIITPHIAWATKEASVRAEKQIREEIIRIAQGHTPKNLVNKDALNL